MQLLFTMEGVPIHSCDKVNFSWPGEMNPGDRKAPRGGIMAASHVASLEAKLKQEHWEVAIKGLPSSYPIAEVWEVRNHHFPGITLHIAFGGMDDLNVLPLEKCYACHVQGHEDSGIYFSHSRKIWEHDLECFVRSLNEIALNARPACGGGMG